MTRFLLLSAFATAALLVAGCKTSTVAPDSTAAAPSPQPAFPATASKPTFKADKLAAIDRAIAAAIAAGKTPGGVLWLERDGQIYSKAYGDKALAPAPTAASEDTLYDLASLTKVIATTTAVMQLVERGLIALDAPVAKYLPAFAQNGKERTTVRQLLTHHSGLRAGLPEKPAWSGYEKGIAIACAETLGTPDTFLYSDINFIVLGELVRVVGKATLDVHAQREIFGPLKMLDTSFTPPASNLARIAPTELVEGRMLHGVVHDPTSRRMGGVTGHAGLFSTAADLARFCRMIINGGELEGVRILRKDTVDLMTRVQVESNDRRGLGWDIDSRYSAPRGRWFPAGRSFGHTGWTGTSVWIDPEARTFVLFLGNRVHPDGKGDVIPLRREIATLAAEAVGRDQGAVLNGIDVLVRDDFAPLRGLRIGLIANQSSRDRQGRLTIDLLHGAKDVRLVALFAPEHGIRGTADDHQGDTVDEKTKLPIYSLYTDTVKRAPGMSQADYDLAVIRSRAPKPEQLEQIDALVFDLQDIGARFYTYSATLGAAMEAAAKAGKKMIVLDRVNPIGTKFEGPIQTRAPSFIGFHDIPVRHGMTLGELAVLFNRERRFGAELSVVKIENWTRDQSYDLTGLPWTNPSPSMKSLAAATLYPGFCLLESTSVSMGRGTPHPFEQVGAPYIDGTKLAAELNAKKIHGVLFEPVKFMPGMDHYTGPAATLKYKDQECGGVRAILTDRRQCNVVDLGIELALAVRRLYPKDFQVEPMGRLLGDDETLAAIGRDESLEQIKRRWIEGLAAFGERRKAALLYDEVIER